MGNKMVSGTHCFIERKPAGQVWIQDTSTNGTLLNLTNKITGTKVKLNHGDEIHIVYRKDQPGVTVAYLYQDLSVLAREEADATQEYSSDFELTEESDRTLPIESDVGTPEKTPRAASSASVATKRLREGDTEEKTERKRARCSPDSPSEEEEKMGDSSKPADTEKKGDKTEKDKDEAADAIGENLMCIICQDILHDCISLQPCMHSFCSGCYSDWMKRCDECPTCRNKVERINKNHIVNNLVEAYLKAHPEKRRCEDDIKELDAKNKITKDMLYPKGAVTVLTDEDEDEEYDEDDGSGLSDSGDEGEYGRPSSFDSESEDDWVPVPGTGFTGFGSVFGTVQYGGMYVPPKTVCRQCPEYKAPAGAQNTSAVGQAIGAVGNVVSKVVNLITGVTTTTGPTAGPSGGGNPQTGSSGSAGDAQPSTSTGGATADGVKTMPTAPVYVCKPTENHLLCQCCLQPMPNRKHMRTGNPDFPAQQCPLCYGHYCHSYWGCRKDDCDGCLGKFKELNFMEKNLDTLILENAYESEIFKNYLEDKSISVREVLETCCQKLDNGEYSCQEKTRIGAAFNSSHVMCFRCGIRTFRELAYQYRQSIPNDQLPVAVTGRPHCYWGKNCRTQKSKPQHATRFNHICEQTRTA